MTKETAPALGMDIFAFSTERKMHEYQIIHPGTRKGMGLFVTLQSLRSDGPQAIAKEIEITAMKRNRQNKPLTPAEIRTNTIRIVNACAVSWRWGLDADGNMGHAGGRQIEFTPENILRILEVDEIREQINGELNDEANFY